MATPPSKIGITPPTSELPDPISSPSEPTPPSTTWPLSFTLSPNVSIALDVIAFLTAFSFLIILTLYLRRLYGRKRLGFDVERNSGSAAYARFGLRFEGGDEDEAGNYKLRNSPRRIKRRERERHLERGRQLWKGRVSEIGTMPPGSL